MRQIVLTVNGIPRPGGSKRAFCIKRPNGLFATYPNGQPIIRIVDDAKGNSAWKKLVSTTALQVRQTPLLTCALFVYVMIRMPRPAYHFRSGKFSHELKPDAPYWHTSKPDATKLWRSTEDALTGIIWEDDGQIAGETIYKCYVSVTDGVVQQPGVRICIQDEPFGRGTPLIPSTPTAAQVTT